MTPSIPKKFFEIALHLKATNVADARIKSNYSKQPKLERHTEHL